MKWNSRRSMLCLGAFVLVLAIVGGATSGRSVACTSQEQPSRQQASEPIPIMRMSLRMREWENLFDFVEPNQSDRKVMPLLSENVETDQRAIDVVQTSSSNASDRIYAEVRSSKTGLKLVVTWDEAVLSTFCREIYPLRDKSGIGDPKR